MAGHFRGRIVEWDVVNEAIDDEGQLRYTFWLRNLGPSYIADAFRWAHQADPKAILFYNDYNIEGINAKSDAVYALVRQLKRRGVPIEGVVSRVTSPPVMTCPRTCSRTCIGSPGSA